MVRNDVTDIQKGKKGEGELLRHYSCTTVCETCDVD
jgi:hypothetical protein